jgi:histone H3/H4
MEGRDIAAAVGGRRLARSETHDLSMIIRDRVKVLRAHADEQAAACLADFERKLAAVYSWDDDETWAAAREAAAKEVGEAQAKIAARCVELGIPRTFAPGLELSWHGRGQNALAHRRTELRRVAKSSIDAMTRAAVTRIEKQALELRTQVVAMGLLSEDARVFLESLAPVEEAMRSLDFAEIERRLEAEQPRRKIGYHDEV